MTTADFIAELERKNIHLRAEEDELLIRAPKGALTVEIRADLSARKPEILAVLRQRTQAADMPALPRPVPDPAHRHDPFPLTELQRAYWIGRNSSFELGQVACQSYIEVDVQDIDLERLTQALQRLIQAHDMLRAVVREDGQQQILAEVPRYDVERLDLRGKPAAEVDAKLAEIRDRMSHEVGRTDRWPLFDIRASLLDGGRIRLHLRMELIISDARSVVLLFRDWRRLYENPDADVGVPELSYRDCVLAEYAFRETPHYQKAQAYWRDRLAELPMAPDLPMVQSPATLGQPRFVRRAGQLDDKRWQQLKARATRAGITPSSALCAAFAEALAVWSGTPSFSLNVTFFNRPPIHPRIDEVFGHFASTILLTSSCDLPTFEARAQKLQEQIARDLEHSAYNGVNVLRDLSRLHGNMVVMPVVFTSTLTSQRANTFDLAWLGERVYSVSQTPQVWLDHQITEDAAGLRFTWDTVDELFPAGMMDEVFAAYARLVERLADDADRPADDPDSAWNLAPGRLTPAEHLELYRQVNATEAPLPQGLVLSPFLDHAARQPDHPAVITTGRTVSYGELERAARSLGHRLRAAGARPDTLVAVVADKGWEQIAGALAAVYAGAAYLPIDPSVPPKRLAYLLENGQVERVVTVPTLDESLAWPAGIERLIMDESLLAAESEPLSLVQRPDHLAYVIYTSGSTGAPKGVMIEHRSVLNLVDDVNRRFAVAPADRMLALSAFTFDLSVYDLFGILGAGATLVMPDADKVRDPEHWLALMHEHHVSLWNSAPPLMSMLMEVADAQDLALPDSLRLCMMSGDWIPVDLPTRIRHRGRNTRVMSLGGPTETTIWNISYPIGETIDPAWKSIPYGKPTTNQHYYVLDQHLEQRPIWVPGQLYAGGAGVARGYWRDEERTRTSFVIHPRTGERLYRCGDLGRFLPDGNIEILGREDFQVKIRGYRVELGEIEAALLEHPAMRQAVVLAAGDLRGHKRLAAYVVLSAPKAASEDELREHLRDRLPDYMVPAFFVELERVPLSPNGKVDRKALPKPDAAAQDTRARFVAPQNQVEEQIAAAWRSVLRTDAVGVHDNFYEIGGDSMLMLQVLSILRQSVDPDLTAVDLFRYPTVGALARYCADKGNEQAALKENSQARAAARKDFLRRRERGAPPRRT